MKKRSLVILLALLLCLGLLSAGAAASSGGSSAGSGEHTHYLCGGDSCTEVGHTETDEVTFEPWTSTNSLPEEGNKAYYLTGNVTIDRPWQPKDGTVLCLNGNSINKLGTGDAIVLKNGAQLILCDCKGGGKITHSGGFTGRGVNIGSGCTFTMYGGTITGNSYDSGAGGVYVAANGTFIMNGGEISGNTGGGVDVENNTSTFTVSGYVTITGNTNSRYPTRNVFLGGNSRDNLATITIDGALNAYSRIGVMLQYSPNVTIATGATDNNTPYTTIFTSDIEGFNGYQGMVYYLVFHENNGVVLKGHVHNWKLTKNDIGDTCTATCVGVTANTASCHVNGGDGGSITIVKPEHAQYGDGLAANATLTGSFNDAVGATVGSITYYKGTEELGTTAPTDAGTYTAELTVGGQTIQVGYTIAQAQFEASDFNFTAPGDPTYDGNVKTAAVTPTDAVQANVTEITVKYFKDGQQVSEPKAAGTYTVKIDVKGDGNYANATLTSDDWKFTIEQLEVKINFENMSDRVYGDNKIVTATVTNKIGNDEVNVVITGGDATAVSSHTVTITGLTGADADNYKLNSGIYDKNYTIEKAPTKVVGAPEPVPDLTYTGQAQELITTVGVSAKNNYNGNLLDLPVVYSLTEDGTYTAAIPTGENAGTYTVYYKVQGDTNYSDSAVNSVDVTIGRATITVTPYETKSKTYGDPDPVLKYQVEGAQNNEEPGFTGALAVGDGSPVGVRYITLGTLALANNGSFQASNYDLKLTDDSTAKMFHIYQKRLTNLDLSGLTVTKVYDSGTGAGTLTGTIGFVGKVGTDDVSIVVETVGEYADANVGTGKTITLTLKLDGEQKLCYTLESGTIQFNGAEITQKDVTITGAVAADKTYDGYAAATVTSVTIPGLNGDLVRGTDFEVVSAAFSDKNAGDNKTVTIQVRLIGTAATNYHLTGDTYRTTATISRKGLVANGVEIEDKTYDGTRDATVAKDGKLHGAVYSQDGVVTGDTVILKVTSEFADKDAGKDKTVNLTYVLEGGDAGNYELVEENGMHQTTAIATIELKRISPESVIVANKDYNKKTNADATVTFNTGVANETLVQGVDYKVVGTFMEGGDPDPNAGENKFVSVQVRLLDTDLAKNYTFGTSGDQRVTVELYDGQATINKINQSIVAGQVNGVYGETGRKIEVSGVQENAVVTFNTLNSEIVTVDERTGELTFHKAGSTSIQITVWETANYKSTQKLVTVAVDKRDIRIAALDRTAYVGSAPDLSAPTLDTDYEIIGLVDGDDLDDLTFAMHYEVEEEDGNRSTILPADMTPGTYIIVIELVSGTDDRYAITSCDAGTLTLDAIPAYTVKVNDTEHGAVASNRRSAIRGQTVTLTVTPDEGYELTGLTVTDRSGKTVTLTDKGDGKYTFKMPGSRVTVSASFRRLSVFTDIDDAWYTDAIRWAEEMGIARDDDGSGLFRPTEDCTRAGIVTFLWRAAGCPEPTGTENPFTDVSESDPWYKAVLWAWENGVTKGYGVPTLFAPTATSTRAQTVLFLKRAVKADDVTTGNDFTDVPEGAYFENGVNWAVSEGLTNGYDDPSIFAPNMNCSRAEIIAFIYRLLTK